MSRKQATPRRKSGQFRRGVSGNPNGRPRIEPRTDAASSRAWFPGLISMMDGWQNTTTGLGIAGKDKSVATTFTIDLVVSEDALTIWRGDPIGARIVEGPPNEALRQGFELIIDDGEMPDQYKPPEPAPLAVVSPKGPSAAATKPISRGDAFRRAYAQVVGREPAAYARSVHKKHTATSVFRRDSGDAKPLQEKITKQLDRLQAAASVKEAMCYERAYGGGAVFIGANDYTTDLRQPLDIKKVRSLDYLTPLEGREIIPLYYYNDPMAPKYGQPAIYQLIPYVIGSPVGNFQARVTQVHESRLLTFQGIRVSRRIMQTSSHGWGDSIFTRCIRALRAFNVGHQSAEVLLSDFAQAVYKIKGLADLIAKDPNALTDSMMNVELGRAICRAVVIDADEEFERKSTTMTGYPETMDRQAQNLAGAADMPLTLMLGTSPAGENATGASDIRFYYDRIASLQSLRVAPALMRLVEILLAIEGENPDKINYSIKFKPLWQPTEKEIAEAHFTQAQADAIYLDRDVVSAEEMALSRFGGDQFSFETRIDFDARAAQNAVVAPTVNAKPDATMPGASLFEYSPDQSEKGPIPDSAKTPALSSEGKPGFKIEE